VRKIHENMMIRCVFIVFIFILLVATLFCLISCSSGVSVEEADKVLTSFSITWPDGFCFTCLTLVPFNITVNALDQNGEIFRWSGTVDILLTNANVTVDPETVDVNDGTVQVGIVFDTITMRDEETRIKLRYGDVITELGSVLQIQKVLDTYLLTITNDGNGTTNPSDEMQVEHGIATDIEATPDETYSFVNWTITSGTGAAFEDAYDASTTVTLTDGDATIQANFSQNVYQLTIRDDGHGTTTPSGNIQVIEGVPTDITAEPDEKYAFDNWSIENGTGISFDDAGSAETMVVLTDGDAKIQANFIFIVGASASPSAGSTIGADTTVIITFNTSMDTGTIALGGDMASESDGGVWSETTYPDDTLTINPDSAWTGGSVRTLSVDCDDLVGNSLSTLHVSYTVDATLPSAVASPESGSTISESASIVITFSESMDTGTLVFGGDMASESDGGVWSETTYTDDTLTINPSIAWTDGSGRTLSVDCEDLAGNSLLTLNLSYTVDVTLPTAVASPVSGSWISG